MKNRILFISLAVVLALSVGLIGCGDGDGDGGPTAPEKIYIGLVRDLDEGLSFFECNAGGSTWRWFIDKVNSEGGIHLSAYDTAEEDCYVLLEPMLEDFSLATFDISVVTEGVIEDGADFIWGGPGTATINPQAIVCNAEGVLHFTLEGGASTMIWDGDIDTWPFTWVSLTFANWYQMPVLSQILNAYVDSPTAYVTYIEDAHGLEYLQAFSEEFGAENILPAGDTPGVGHAYYMTSEEANVIIQNAAAVLASTGYDLFCGFTYPWNVAELIGACIANGFNPPAIMMGPGANFGMMSAPGPTGFGPMMEGIMCFATANPDTVVTQGMPTMTMAEMYSAIAGQLEEDWVDPELPCDPGTMTSGDENYDYWGHACYVSSMEMWKYAVEEVGDLDTDAIRDVLVSYSSDNPASTVWGDTWYRVFGYDPISGGYYGGGIIDYLCQTGQIGQWQSGVIEIIGYDGITAELPNYDATADIIYPMTGKWAWLGG